VALSWIGDWQVEYLRLMCNSGVMAGDQVEAASPNDISFWPIHPTLERLWQWKKMKVRTHTG
jgi:hypothetical protein